MDPWGGVMAPRECTAAAIAGSEADRVAGGAFVSIRFCISTRDRA